MLVLLATQKGRKKLGEIPGARGARRAHDGGGRGGGGAATARVPRQQQAGLGVLFDHDPWPVSADALTELAYVLAGVGCRPWQRSGSSATRHGGRGGGCGAARPLQLRLQPMTARWDPMRPLRHYHLLLRATAPGRHSICFSDPPAINRTRSTGARAGWGRWCCRATFARANRSRGPVAPSRRRRLLWIPLPLRGRTARHRPPATVHRPSAMAHRAQRCQAEAARTM